MYVDALTIAALVDECEQAILGGRVQEVLCPQVLEVGLEIYSRGRRHFLLASAHPQLARVHLTSGRLRRGVDTPSPLLLLLRKWVRGARIENIQAPPYERILRLSFDHPAHGLSTLVIEVMGRHSNIILLDAGGQILECVKRVGPDVNRYRVILPRKEYIPPPPQNKLQPPELTGKSLREILEAAGKNTPLPKALVGGLAGVSPLLAREATHRAYGDGDITCQEIAHLEPLLDSLKGLFFPDEADPWKVSIAIEPAETGENASARDSIEAGAFEPADEHTPSPPVRVKAFAPYDLTHLSPWKRVESMGQAIELWVRSGAPRGDEYAGARARVREMLRRSIEKTLRQREQLEKQQATQDEVERLRRFGELILAFGWNLSPGQTELHVDPGDGSPQLRIPVDPDVSPADNAQAFFKRYSKARRAHDELPAILDAVQAELEFLHQLELDLKLARNRLEIEEVREEWKAGGYLKEESKKKRPPASQPLKVTLASGETIFVGRNSRQNELLTFKMAIAGDIWLHARGIPGAHVILRFGSEEPSEDALRKAAALAAYYSAGQDEARVEVVYTHRRHVRRLSEGRPGQVIYRHERTIAVRPEPE